MGFLHGVGGDRAGALESNFGHTLFEELAIFAFANGIDLGTDEFDIMAGEGTRFVESHGSIESGLASESGKNCVWFFFGDDFFDYFGRNGLDVGAIGEFRIGHDGGGVTIDEDDLVAFFAQGFAGLDT